MQPTLYHYQTWHSTRVALYATSLLDMVPYARSSIRYASFGHGVASAQADSSIRYANTGHGVARA
eukprot:3941107-Rhodomonas_salina.3